MTNQLIKEAVYVGLSGATFYYAAKYLKADTNAALIIGTAVGKIIATSKLRKYDTDFTK